MGLCYLARDFLLLFVTLVYSVPVFALNPLSPLRPLCQACDRLFQLERKLRALEQENSLETTEGTLTSLRRYLNRPNSEFDRFEVLDLLQALCASHARRLIIRLRSMLR